MNLDAIVRCPRCRGALTPREGGYDCAACKLHYARAEGGFVDFVPADARPLAEPGPAKR